MCVNINHSCIIGELYGYDNARLVDLVQLKESVQQNIELAAVYNGLKSDVLGELYKPPKVYTLADYCDGRKSTNLIRFNYCPCCGEKIDWKAIKEGANGTTN